MWHYLWSLRSLDFVLSLMLTSVAFFGLFFLIFLNLWIYFLVLRTLRLRLDRVFDFINYALIQSAGHNHNINFFIVLKRNEHFFLFLQLISTFFGGCFNLMYFWHQLNIFFDLVEICMILNTLVSFLFGPLNCVHIIHFLWRWLNYFILDFL